MFHWCNFGILFKIFTQNFSGIIFDNPNFVLEVYALILFLNEIWGKTTYEWSLVFAELYESKTTYHHICYTYILSVRLGNSNNIQYMLNKINILSFIGEAYSLKNKKPIYNSFWNRMLNNTKYCQFVLSLEFWCGVSNL